MIGGDRFDVNAYGLLADAALDDGAVEGGDSAGCVDYAFGRVGAAGCVVVSAADV